MGIVTAQEFRANQTKILKAAKMDNPSFLPPESEVLK